MKSRIEEKLDDLVLFHEELIEDLPDSFEDFTEQRIVRRGVEKTIQLIAASIVDIALMIISEQGYEKPLDSRQAIITLEKKVLSKRVSKQIQDLISFRNLLVHRYGKIREREEYETIIENHGDILAFASEVKKFLHRV